MAALNNFGYGSGHAPAQSAGADTYGDDTEFNAPHVTTMPLFVQ